MKAPLSWLQDYVDLADLSLEEIATTLTMLGLEVENVHLVGMAKPDLPRLQFKYDGLSWAEDKFVVAEVREVNRHPNADKLTLCQLDDGLGERVVLTGAPNLHPFIGQGRLAKPIKVAYAREGAQLYDGHANGNVLTKIKKVTIRGVESSSMIVSEKELGISEENEGVIFFEDDAPVGMPLVKYIGDAVFEISILPNMARNACILGLARELATALKRDLRTPRGLSLQKGGAIADKVSIDIRDKELNPRFMLGMVTGSSACKSPARVQRRLSMAGMRPIDALVDATNYTMLETGEPLHAFDYDLLRARAGGQKPCIITRRAENGEKLTTLDGVCHELTRDVELVSDTAGALSLAGVMGGSETGVHSGTTNVLIEAASWNFINIRKTLSRTRINSEASWRFSRNVHPALAEQALSLCLQRVLDWGGGQAVEGVLDACGVLPAESRNSISAEKLECILGLKVPMKEAREILTRLGFVCELHGDVLSAITPPTRTDIEDGLAGEAGLIEEISRIYGYNRIPACRLNTELPVQASNPVVDFDEALRDVLVAIGLQDTLAYRQTSPEREAKIRVDRSLEADYVRLKNPISPERTVMRRSSLATMLELLEFNNGHRSGLAFFELGPVFLPRADETLPLEARRLALGLWGAQQAPHWDRVSSEQADFFTLKGLIEALLDGLHLKGATFEPCSEQKTWHPGKCARIMLGEEVLGLMGELHPQVKEHYHLPEGAILLAELDVDALARSMSKDFNFKALSSFPTMVEDIALIVDEGLSAADLERSIYRAGGSLLVGIRLFDLYRGEKLGAGKKSMAYQLTYQAPDRTLGVKDAETIRARIVRNLAREFGAVLRSA